VRERYFLLWLLWITVAACTRTHELVPAPRDAGVASDAAIVPVAADCQGHPCACSNGIDDDGDELIDGFDPECTSASDDYENSFATGVHGEDQTQKCQDCFFDSNSGRGSDDCNRARSCALDGTATGGTGACRATCEVGEACRESCAPLAPNGCDCFGCCGVFLDGVEVYVLLSDTCSLAALKEADKCTRCMPSTECMNPCGRCELCAGRRARDLPSDCAAGYACDDAVTCRHTSDCASSEYCQQGCCLQVGI